MAVGPFTSLWVFDQTDLASWMQDAKNAILALQNKPGFIEAIVSRSPDEPSRLIVTSKWVDVGSYRRALSSYDAKISVWPFLANMHDQPSAFEVLLSADSQIISEYQSSLET